jgi:hypothetical protein
MAEVLGWIVAVWLGWSIYEWVKGILKDGRDDPEPHGMPPGDGG